MDAPNKEQVAAALRAMRRAHEKNYVSRITDQHLEQLFWAGFMAVWVNEPVTGKQEPQHRGDAA